jgi:hypothetical protein
LVKAINDPSKLKAVLTLKEQSDNLFATMIFLATQIAGYLQSRPNKGTGPTLDLSNMYLHQVDLSDVNFSKIDLTQANLNGARLKGATLTPKGRSQFEGINLVGRCSG